MTDTESKSFKCAFVSMLKHMTILRMVIRSIISSMVIIRVILINDFQAGLNLSVPWVPYKLDYTRPILYVITIESILGKTN
jgi:hypothetical protein